MLTVTIDALTHPGRDVFAKIEDAVPPKDLRSLRSALERFSAAGYTAAVAVDGWSIRTSEPSEKVKVRAIRDALPALQQALQRVLEQATHRVSQREINRIFAATQAILGVHTLHVADQAAKLAPDFGLNVKPSALAMISNDLDIEFELTSDFEVTEKMVSRYKTTITKTVSRQGVWGRIRDWFGKQTVSEDVYENVEELRGEIPSVYAIAGAWEIQAIEKRHSVSGQFYMWLIQQINAVKQSIEAYQENLLASYHERLDQAHSEAKEVFDDDHEFWTETLDVSRLFTESLNELRKLSTNGER